MSDEKKRTITRGEYHQLCGLLVLGQRHSRSLDEIQAAAGDIIGDREWASDAIHGGIADYNADDLLQRMGIEVAE